MKPIIVEMENMSDSTEIYESRPNPFFVYFIYLLASIFIIALLWMGFSKLDIVVKGDGIFKSDESVYEVSSVITGVVSECNVSGGQYVEEGDVLYVLEQLYMQDEPKDNLYIKAKANGLFYPILDIKAGSFIQQGTAIGNIYLGDGTKFYGQIYVDNSDIGKMKEGQEVKFEIPAYPSSEYGQLTGKVTKIPKDITIDQVTGKGYYMVEVSCDASDEEISLKNGMACQASVVVGHENVLKTLLRKIDLID